MEVTTAQHKLAEAMYAKAAASGPQGGTPAGDGPPGGSKPGEDVIDADYKKADDKS